MKTAKRRIMQTTPHDNAWTQVLKICTNTDGIIPNRSTKCSWDR